MSAVMYYLNLRIQLRSMMQAWQTFCRSAPRITVPVGTGCLITDQ